VTPPMARILVLTSMYPPHHYGGYELLCRDVVERWRAAGHDVEVLTSTVRVAGEREGTESGVQRVLEIYWDDHEITNPPIPRRLQMERGNQRALRGALERFAPDVVSVWAVGAMSLGLLVTLAGSGRPLVYVVCDDWVTYAPAIDAWMRPFATRPRLATLAHAVTRLPTRVPRLGTTGTFLFMSEHSRRIADRHIGPLAESSVVYGGIDTRDLPIADGEEVAASLARPFGWRILVVSRIDPRKGIATVIRALAQLPDAATLDIVGRGDDRHLAELRALVGDLGLERRVRFTSVSRPELRERYSAADVFVFPSEWQEPFGLVPVEAMAAATPVVGTGTGGSGEFLVDGVNCVRYPRGDVDALVAALHRVAADSDLRRRIVTGGIATATDLTMDRWAANLEAWHLAARERFAHGRPADRHL